MKKNGKILFVLYTYYPDAVGGTEVYAKGLASRLQERGWGMTMTAPSDLNQNYLHDDLRVRRFAISAAPLSLNQMYGEGDLVAETNFLSILKEENPDIVHFHALSPAVSPRLAMAAKKSGAAVVFTYHTATATCQRGSMMLWGKEMCDGRMNAQRCAACVLQSRGLSRPAARVVAATPGIGWLAEALGLSGGMWTALRMKRLIAVRTGNILEMFRRIDRVVAVCEWVRKTLRVNGVLEEKIFFSRQGLAQEAPYGECRKSEGCLRLVYLGRVDPGKGIQLLIEAVRANPELDLKLDVYGVCQNDCERAALEALKNSTRMDARIAFCDPVPSAEVLTVLKQYDWLAVPSQCPETGPLVVLEAFAAGIPVLGTRLGGIAELVQDGVSGKLVRPGDSVEAWSAALKELFHPGISGGPKKPVLAPLRTMTMVADDMDVLYRELTAS